MSSPVPPAICPTKAPAQQDAVKIARSGHFSNKPLPSLPQFLKFWNGMSLLGVCKEGVTRAGPKDHVDYKIYSLFSMVFCVTSSPFLDSESPLL